MTKPSGYSGDSNSASEFGLSAVALGDFLRESINYHMSFLREKLRCTYECPVGNLRLRRYLEEL